MEFSAESFDGSSPLARGTLAEVQEKGAAIRLIPARAGNMSMGRGYAAQNAAHPRSRGEHLRGGLEHLGGSGSSPLARGTFFHD